MTKINTRMSYNRYLDLPYEERLRIESSLVSTCKHYLDEGYSIPLSIRKVITASPFTIEAVNKIIRGNTELSNSFFMRIQRNKLTNRRCK